MKSVGLSTDLSFPLFHVGEMIGVVFVVFVGAVAGGVEFVVVVRFGYSTVHCSHILQ